MSLVPFSLQENSGFSLYIPFVVCPHRQVNKNGELARAVAETTMKEGWKIEELHTEEGRLDEVFRSITLPDTVKAQEEKK